MAKSGYLALSKGVLEDVIHEVRGQKVILDRDLAVLYGVPTRSLNQAVKRNRLRFPKEFAFLLTAQEVAALKSQFVTSSWGGARRALPHAFTEHGALMAANVLISRRAVQMSVAIVQTFVRLRRLALSIEELVRNRFETCAPSRQDCPRSKGT